MEILSNIEVANWVRREDRLLLVSGWALMKDGTPVTVIRLRQTGWSSVGYYGISRPDVAKAHPEHPDAQFCGFSFLAALKEVSLPCTLELQDNAGGWHKCRVIEPAQITHQAVPAPVSTELEDGAADHLSTPPIDNRPVLFISHDFAFAGAQVILLRLLRWLRKNSDLAIEVLIAVPRHTAGHASTEERHLLSGFNETGSVHFLSDLTHAPENLGRIHRNRYRLIYANTGTLGWLLPSLRPFTCPVISHVYELGFWLKRRTGKAVFNRQATQTDLFLAGGQAVHDLLVNEMSVPASKTRVVYACASIERAKKALTEYSRQKVRHTLGIPGDAFVVEACGTLDWRKGAELFVPICVALRRKLAGRSFRAIWIGDPGAQIVKDQFLHDIESAGLAEQVTLVAPQQNLPWWMLAADCFALPSHEDPFPMVMLEAGVLGLPVVGFQHSGGIVEYAGKDAGIVVPFLDVEAFADALASLAADPAAATRRGLAGQQRVAQSFDEEISFQLIAELITNLATPAHLSHAPQARE